MYHYKIELVTMNDILNFVNDVSKITGEVKLSDGKSFCINGKACWEPSPRLNGIPFTVSANMKSMP